MQIFPYISMHYSLFKMWFNDLVRTPTLSAILTASAIGFVTLLFFFQILQHKRRRNNTRLPPGPCLWPIIGNIHQLSLPTHRALKNLVSGISHDRRRSLFRWRQSLFSSRLIRRSYCVSIARNVYKLPSSVMNQSSFLSAFVL